MDRLSSEQVDKALYWTGPLTEACVILDMPFRRAWNYVSGRPISIRPVLTSADAKARLPRGVRSKIGKNKYSHIELVKLRLGDTLLSAGLPGKVVQPLLDGALSQALSRMPGGQRLDTTILVIYNGIDDPVVMAFSWEKHEEFDAAFLAALDIGAARCVLTLGSIEREIIRRTVCHQERREYVCKSPGQMVKEALSRARRDKDAIQVHK